MPSALAKNKLDSLELLLETPVNFLALTVLEKKWEKVKESSKIGKDKKTFCFRICFGICFSVMFSCYDQCPISVREAGN